MSKNSDLLEKSLRDHVSLVERLLATSERLDFLEDSLRDRVRLLDRLLYSPESLLLYRNCKSSRRNTIILLRVGLCAKLQAYCSVLSDISALFNSHAAV